MAAVIAFLFVPIEKQIGFIALVKGLNNFHIFLIDVIISMLAYGLTKFFVAFYQM
ncbi:hypothetical protein ACTQ5K_02475 [Niallia sp. Sow4_A1]|uniref:hypothetical protein n=1 Tax=Niallia sp. Sow4_A1 TaxID=3438793 RepID=UPI003F9606AF